MTTLVVELDIGHSHCRFCNQPVMWSWYRDYQVEDDHGRGWLWCDCTREPVSRALMARPPTWVFGL